MDLSRRQVLAGGAGALAASVAAPATLRAQAPGTVRAPSGVAPEALARDERFWRRVARLYDVSDEVVNLEAGYYGIMNRPVHAEYRRQTDALNESNSYYLRTRLARDYEAARDRVARVLGVAPDEIAFTRNATEALQYLIGNYNKLRPDDTVLYADLDYPDMQEAMNWLRLRRGARVATFGLPEPAHRQAVLDAYDRALRDHPETRLLLVTHMSNRTGLVPPTAEIVAMARARGVDTIVDAAHSWGHLDLTIADLGCDFAGFNLHKWIGAPLGVGFMYIRRQRLADIDRAYANEDYPADDIRSRTKLGTWNVAALNTVPSALEFHLALGPANKEARLQYLRDRWALRAPELGPYDILTPNDHAAHGAITSFRMRGRGSSQDNKAIATWLLDNHRLFTVSRDGVAAGSCVRVTPALYNTVDDLDLLVEALRRLARTGLPG